LYVKDGFGHLGMNKKFWKQLHIRNFVETSYYRLYTTSNTISMNAITRAWRLQLEECREEKARAS
jgi:hypothetical protein